jgi:cytoskeleton protein RodZ
LASFGEKLRQSREAKQITLQEISAATKISCRALEALEAENFDKLPGGIFNKGFVRAYARYVGLDEAKMVDEYLIAAKLVPAEPEKLPAPAAPAPPRILPATPDWKAEPKTSGIGGIRWVSILAMAVALLLGWLWWKEHRREQREMAPLSAPAATTSVPAAAPQFPAQPSSGSAVPAQASKSQSETPLPPAASSAPVEITITAKQPSWISVRRDGGSNESMILDPSKPELRSRSYQAQKELRLVVGNPEGVVVTFNGKAVEKLSEPGRTARILFTPEGMKRLQPPPKAAKQTAVEPGADNSAAGTPATESAGGGEEEPQTEQPEAQPTQ